MEIDADAANEVVQPDTAARRRAWVRVPLLAVFGNGDSIFVGQAVLRRGDDGRKTADEGCAE